MRLLVVGGHRPGELLYPECVSVKVIEGGNVFKELEGGLRVFEVDSLDTTRVVPWDTGMSGAAILEESQLACVGIAEMVAPNETGSHYYRGYGVPISVVTETWTELEDFCRVVEITEDSPGQPKSQPDKIKAESKIGKLGRRLVFWGLFSLAAFLLFWWLLMRGPEISITDIPLYDERGGPDTSATIAGSVSGVEPAEHLVVIYSYTILWYVQPTELEPFTQIDKQGGWRADGIHTGKRYAALLVKRGFEPKSQISSLPTSDSKVVAYDLQDGKKQ
jgi:hypothetical protein